jgi:hypothetical protein
MDDKLHFGMPEGCEEYDDDGGKSDESDAIPTSSRPRRAPSELVRFDLGTRDVDGNEWR